MGKADDHHQDGSQDCGCKQGRPYLNGLPVIGTCQQSRTEPRDCTSGQFSDNGTDQRDGDGDFQMT